jgi:hypothetical protein
MTQAAPLKTLWVDPSVFTSPYDVGLAGSLVAGGVGGEGAEHLLRRSEPPAIALKMTESPLRSSFPASIGSLTTDRLVARADLSPPPTGSGADDL